MAADWIKMRVDLQSHPKVVRILSATKSDKLRVIGGLHAVWAVFDTHSVDGRLAGYTADLMDHVIGWPGFSAAMMAVGWLGMEGPETLVIPEFSTHNGQSAKRRAEDQKRKRDSRSNPQPVRNMSANEDDKLQSESGLEREREEEKKREEADSASGDAPAAKPKREQTGSRLPDDWQPDDQLVTWAKSERPDLNIATQTASFRDYWRSQPGQKGRKSDWPATFRNWIRNARRDKSVVPFTQNGGSRAAGRML